MNSKQLSIVLGVIVVILLAMVGYMALRDNSQDSTLNQLDTVPNSNTVDSNSDTTQPLNNTNTTPTQTDETANWKTYTSPSSAFTLKYPSSLKVSCPGEACELISLSLDSNEYHSYFDLRENNPPQLPQSTVAIGSFTNYPNAGNDLYKWRQSWAPSGLNPSATYRTTTINGLAALEEKTTKFKAIFILDGNTIREFTVNPLNTANEQLFDKIIATVDFQ